jgi:YD repeat-containing protein
VTTPLGTTAYTYNEQGRITSVTAPKGEVTTLSYAANAVDLEQIENGLGALNLSYNDTHDITSITDNDLNHVTVVTYPDGRSKTSTYSGCCPRLVDRATDRAGRVTTFDYDALKRPIRTTNPEGGVTQFAYDPNGNLTAINYDDATPDVSYAYDAYDRLTQMTDGLGATATTPTPVSSAWTTPGRAMPCATATTPSDGACMSSRSLAQR